MVSKAESSRDEIMKEQKANLSGGSAGYQPWVFGPFVPRQKDKKELEQGITITTKTCRCSEK